MPEPFDFAQKIALVAGGTGGLGGLIAAELRGRGCIVTTVSRSNSSDTAHISADLRSPEAISDVMNTIVERHGALDIVINAM
jgi:NAD(P)-dependent dehydrogenase (short-subunit alcohol dehydrogenase family)